jgi:shikimate kinase
VLKYGLCYKKQSESTPTTIMERIFLVGFMGCGKSHTGKVLAAEMGYDFIDVDDILENTEGVSIAQIFENQGETYFRTLENKTLKQLGERSKTIIATGGGAPCFYDNMAWMNANGITIYLKAEPELLLSRLKNEMEKRPLLRGRSEADLLAFIATKLAEREPFYSQANITIEQTDGGTSVMKEVIAILKVRSLIPPTNH